MKQAHHSLRESARLAEADDAAMSDTAAVIAR
jgi:hypothetical protein